MAIKSTPDEIRAWAVAWDVYSEYAEQERRERLADFDHKENCGMIDSLLQIGAQTARPRDGSGLIEQQRLFTQIRLQRAGAGSPS